MVHESEQLGSNPDRQRRLFAVPEDGERMTQTPPTPLPGEPRLRLADREQVKFRSCCWNDLLPDDHQARVVWKYVKQMDLSPLREKIKSVRHNAGHPATDPRILVALWFLATLRGIGSARELDRRCGESGEIPFQWICGDVSVNYHTLADFRVQHVEFLDQFLTDSVAVLLQEELVTLDRTAQDGMKVRASAGASSFRRKPTLEEHREQARQQIEALKEELQNDPAAGNARQKAARERAAREREERLQKAIEQHAEIEAQKKTAEKKENARASTTDPEARVMKMGDGGFRPAYNVQFATDTETQIITGVDVTNSGGDQGKMAPMIEQHQERYGKTPQEHLVDGGFVKKEDIVAVSEPHGNTKVYAPVMVSKTSQRDPHEPRPDDKPAVAEWRQRMATDEAKEIYKERAATAECVNAIARNRGLQQFRVRGRPKVRAVILWYVLAHNLLRTVALRAAATKER